MRDAHACMPAIPDQRVAQYSIWHTSGWEDSLIGTSVPSGCTPAAAINPASRYRLWSSADLSWTVGCMIRCIAYGDFCCDLSVIAPPPPLRTHGDRR